MTSPNGNISASLSLCAGNSPVTGELPSQRLVTRSFGVSLICALNKQSWCWWFETPSRSLWRHCNGSNPSKGCLAICPIFSQVRGPTKRPTRSRNISLHLYFIWACLYLKAVKMAFDDVLQKYVGQAGRYQILLIIALCVIFTPDPFSSMELVFITITPAFWPKG